jgi:predicted RNase H-like HicB family nuclease
VVEPVSEHKTWSYVVIVTYEPDGGYLAKSEEFGIERRGETQDEAVDAVVAAMSERLPDEDAATA